MYVRPEGRRQRAISIPENYSGNAFNDDSAPSEKDCLSCEAAQASACDSDRDADDREAACAKGGNFLPINIGNEELIVLAIILLLFRDGDSDDIIPLLLAILFLGSK